MREGFILKISSIHRTTIEIKKLKKFTSFVSNLNFNDELNRIETLIINIQELYDKATSIFERFKKNYETGSSFQDYSFDFKGIESIFPYCETQIKEKFKFLFGYRNINEFDDLCIFTEPKILKFQIESEKWSLIDRPPSLPKEIGKYSSVARLLDTTILLTGSLNPEYSKHSYLITIKSDPSNKIECDRMADTFESRGEHCSCVLDEFVYILGGFNGIDRLASCEKYDVELNKWTMIAPMSTKRDALNAITQSNKIYVFGGYDGSQYLDTIEIYDSFKDSWEVSPVKLSFPICNHSLIRVSHNEIVLIGGYNGTGSARSGYLFDLNESVKMIKRIKLTDFRNGAVCFKWKDHLYFIGGAGSDNLCKKAKIGMWGWYKFKSCVDLVMANIYYNIYFVAFA